jgi:hypothetical protein
MQPIPLVPQATKAGIVNGWGSYELQALWGEMVFPAGARSEDPRSAFLRRASTLRRARSRAQVALGSRCAARGLPCCDGHVRVQRALGALGVPVRRRPPPLTLPPTASRTVL